MADYGQQMTNDERRAADDGRRMADVERQMMDDRRQTADDGQRMTEDERQMADFMPWEPKSSFHRG